MWRGKQEMTRLSFIYHTIVIFSIGAAAAFVLPLP
jgi:hypothetical protein